jgi:hypothetical protein
VCGEVLVSPDVIVPDRGPVPVFGDLVRDPRWRGVWDGVHVCRGGRHGTNGERGQV